MHAAYGKSSLSSPSLERLSGLTGRPRGMGTGLQGGWFNSRGLFRGSGGAQEKSGGSRAERSQAPVSVEEVSSELSACSTVAAASSPKRTVRESNSDSNTTVTATVTADNDPSSSSTSTSVSHVPSSGNENDGGTCKPVSRRLVLEILMSPSSSTGDGQGGALSRATGVRLKLENASFESLANLAEAASSGVDGPVQIQGASIQSVSSTGQGSGPVTTYELTTANDDILAGARCSSSRDVSASTRADEFEASFSLSPTDETRKRDGASSEGTRALPVESRMRGDALEEESGPSHSGSLAIISACADNQGDGVESISTASRNTSAADPCKNWGNGSALTVSSSAKGKARAPSSPTEFVVPVTYLKGALARASLGLDSLNCLRISVLEGFNRGNKSTIKDSPKSVTAEIASALAALNVDSIGGNAIGMGGGNAIGMGPVVSPVGSSSDASGRSGVSERVNAILEEEFTGEGSGSEHIPEDGDDGHRIREVAEEDEGDGNRREKRKKRNKQRRQKAKAAASKVAAAAAILEVQERHLTFRRAVDSETGSGSGETEVGCICRTPKGGCHINACPYPFTSSGSMVQRKIKEQYDDLVRSNVARTLTLAQVGRFTTCLVEAKSALQQKSDTIQRRFTIAKSLLSKADKSSFDRLCGQIYGLEIEQKKLEEDTVVYNRLQEQLKLSPAYQKMLEYGRAHFELQPNTGQLIEKVDTGDKDISFEDLLAKEKKDAFWQKHGPSRSSMQVI